MASAEGEDRDEEIGLTPPILVTATLTSGPRVAPLLHEDSTSSGTGSSGKIGLTPPILVTTTLTSGPRVAPLLHEDSTSSGTGSSGTWRNSMSTLTLLLALGVVGALPRSLVLLCLKLWVPTVSLPAGLDQFRQMWAPCTDENGFWTNHSPDGLFFRVLVGSDHFFILFGLAGLVMAFHWTILPLSIHSRPGKVLAILTAVLTSMASVGVFTSIVVTLNNPRNNSLAYIDDDRDWRETQLYSFFYSMAVLINLILYSAGVAYTSIFPVSVGQSLVTSRSNVRSASCYGVMLLLTMLFSISMRTLTVHRVVTSQVGWDSAWGLMLPLIISKVFNGALRNLNFTHHRNANLSVSMCSFVVSASTSLASRHLLLSIHEGNLLMVLLMSTAFSLLEMLTQLIIGALHLIKMGTFLQQTKINCLTLDSLVSSHERMERTLNMIFYYLHADQVLARAYAHACVQSCKLIS